MTSQDLKDETTENLIEYIQWREDPDYVENAKEAFKVFTFRFQLDLLQKIIPICKNWGYDDQVATEIAYSTFERIWKYPTFDKAKTKQKDFDQSVRFYLYRIASHLLADYKKSEQSNPNPFTGDEEIIYDFPDIENVNISRERKTILKERYLHIKNALERLTPKHKIIYLTYKQYESEIDEGYKLPRKLLKKLRTELDLTQNTVRSYKNEAITQIDTYFKIYGSK